MFGLFCMFKGNIIHTSFNTRIHNFAKPHQTNGTHQQHPFVNGTMKEKAKYNDYQSKNALKTNTAITSESVKQALKGKFKSTFEPIHLRSHPVRQTSPFHLLGPCDHIPLNEAIHGRIRNMLHDESNDHRLWPDHEWLVH